MQKGLLREVISGHLRPSILRSGLCPVLARWQSSSIKDGEFINTEQFLGTLAPGVTSYQSQHVFVLIVQGHAKGYSEHRGCRLNYKQTLYLICMEHGRG